MTLLAHDALEDALAMMPVGLVLRHVNHRHAVTAGRRQRETEFLRDLAEELVRELEQDARAVAGVGFAAACAAMVEVDEVKPSLLRILREGFMVGVLNPKAIVFFTAVFPQFVDPKAGSVTVQLLLFGLIFSLLSIVLDGTWGIVVGSSRDWFVNSDRRLLVLRTIGGVVMLVLGILVIIPVLYEMVVRH